jgi:hypothetical protein
MQYRVHLTRFSRNVKTGPIPVSTTSRSTCPPTCGFFEECYAKYGNLSVHWRRVDNGARSIGWTAFCDEISRLPRRQLWRHNQAGDLPGNGVVIDEAAMRQLIEANRGKRGFTFTHYPLTPHNVNMLRLAKRSGFTVNVSCDSLSDSDRIGKSFDLPRAVMLPSTEKRKVFRRPNGDKVLVCPATYRDDMQCMNCGICYEPSADRAVIGFPAHGTKKRVIDLKLIRSE